MVPLSSSRRTDSGLTGVAWNLKINGERVDPTTLPPSEGVYSPMIIRDTPVFRSPLDNSMVEGRHARREHMKQHGVREVEPSERPKHDSFRNIDWDAP